MRTIASGARVTCWIEWATTVNTVILTSNTADDLEIQEDHTNRTETDLDLLMDLETINNLVLDQTADHVTLNVTNAKQQDTGPSIAHGIRLWTQNEKFIGRLRTLRKAAE